MNSSHAPRPAVPTAYPIVPMPPVGDYTFAPARGVTSEARLIMGILIAIATAVVGFAWLAFGLLLMAYPDDTAPGRRETWIVMSALGLLIALTGIGAIGMASTSSRPGDSAWVRAWVWMASVGAGLLTVIVTAFLLWLQVSGS